MESLEKSPENDIEGDGDATGKMTDEKGL
jgi:hypothetical protein